MGLLDRRRRAQAGDPGDPRHPGGGPRQGPQSPGRQPPLHPRRRGGPSRAGGGRRRPPGIAGARRPATWSTCRGTSTSGWAATTTPTSPTSTPSPPTTPTRPSATRRGSTRSAYVPHNYHFLGAAAMFEGRGKAALEAARHMARPRRPGEDAGARAGHPPALLGHPALHPRPLRPAGTRSSPSRSRPPTCVYPTGVWHYARGMALVRKGQPRRRRRRAGGAAADRRRPGDRRGDALGHQLRSEPARHRRRPARRRAGGGARRPRRRHRPGRVGGPPGRTRCATTSRRPGPSRRATPSASIYLRANRLADAERVYREDLAKFPENGWSLLGLAQSLESQGYEDDAAPVRERFAKAWQHADVEITGSEF